MIELKNITKIYNKGNSNEVTIFKDFNFCVEDGQFISIVGSNGSGKTSLLNCICGDIGIDGGSVLLNGRDVTKLDSYKRYKYIGRVYQNPEFGNCTNLTILENMALADNKGKKFDLTFCVDKKRMDYYKERLSELGLGLEDKINTQISNLSGGQRQAISLIMSVLSHVDILIFDEHTAALDPKTSSLIMEMTAKIIKQNKLTALMVTHNLNYALNYGDRLVALHDGEIALDRKGKEKAKTASDEILQIFEGDLG